MHLSMLVAAGFRSLKLTKWVPGSLNVVIGPNGSGKSNLLRALELISASARGRLQEHLQGQGGMEPLLWDGSVDELVFTILFQPQGEGSEGLRYDLNLRRMGRSGYGTPEDSLREAESQDEVLLERSQSSVYVRDEKNNRIEPVTMIGGETLLSQVQGPFVQNRRIAEARQYFAEWVVHHDLRVDQEAPLRHPVVARYEPRLAPSGQNLINVLHTHYSGDRDFKRDIDSAMRAAFGDDFEELLFPPASDQRVQLRLRWRSLRREASAAELSDGTLRFLLLLTALRAPSPPPLLAIDEPETGLHPSMLPIIAEYAVDASSRTQLILTTHSPQILDAFTGTRPTTTVASRAEGVTNLKVLDEEALAYWLDQYTLGALFRSGELEAMG